MFDHGAQSWTSAAETRPERNSRDVDLPQLGAVVGLYAVYVVAACLLTGPALDSLDAALPGAFSYHLQPDEADGPIGDPMRLATGLWLQSLAFWMTFAPVAVRLRTRANLLVALTILNGPVVLVLMPPSLRWAARLATIG